VQGRRILVIGIRQRNGDLRLIRAKDAKSKTVREIINANVGGEVDHSHRRIGYLPVGVDAML